MTPEDLIADLRSRINPAYANQIGTESWERKLCADALEEQASAIDLLHSWEADAKARASLLEQHLRAVLEVALTWQPAYATKMDRDTLQYAQECADGKDQVCDEMETKQTNWVKSLRDAGIKAAHPNDGWVNRDSNELFFAYPQFNDGACIGDLVMLGWPADEKSQRLVRLIGKRETSLGMMTWWKFQDVSND